jgi:hypothetical protein
VQLYLYANTCRSLSVKGNNSQGKHLVFSRKKGKEVESGVKMLRYSEYVENQNTREMF